MSGVDEPRPLPISGKADRLGGYTRQMVDERPARWTFLSNYGHVLLYIARHPDARLRDIAAAVGITERAAQRILHELVEEGYVARTREGRRNRYTVQLNHPLRHPLESDHTIEELMSTLGAESPAS